MRTADPAAATTVVVIGDLGGSSPILGNHPTVPAGAEKHFDNSTDTWTVTTGAGQELTARILLDASPGSAPIIATHGVPNYFRIPHPHSPRQIRYLAGLLDAMRRSGSTRIEARSRVRARRRLPNRGISRFYLTGSVGVQDEVYDGPAVVTHDGRDLPARVNLTGHFDPIDGKYHWQGTLYAVLTGSRITGSQVSIRIEEHTATARITERTPWGTLSVVGAAGYPPFPLADVEISVPPRV